MKDFTAVCFFLLATFSPGQTKAPDSLPSPFDNNEWFKFRVQYGIFNASYATLEVERDTINSTPVFHAKGYGRTTGLTRLFFRVEDHYESYFDATTGLPYKFIRDMYEGGYTKNVELDFDHNLQKVYVNDKNNKVKDSFDIMPNAQDLISSFYYFRKFRLNKKLKIGETVFMNLFFDNENYVFKLKFLGKELIKTKFGLVKCLKFRPIVQVGRVFREDGKLTLWISNDENKIPLRLQADILIGSIKVDLEAFKNLKHSFKIWVQ